MTPCQRLPGRFFGPPTLVDLLRHRVECQPDDTAFTYLLDGEQQQEHLSYRELDRRARAIGAWLELSGLSGERALLCYPPSLDFIAAFFGCLYANVVAVPVYPPRRNQLFSRIQAIARDAEARVALTTESVISRVQPLTEQNRTLREMTWLATCEVPEGVEQFWEPPEVDGKTLAFLQYTSGSTGVPKGVMLSHTNLMHNSALIAHVFEHTRSGLGVFWLPTYHDMGLIGGILQPLYVGRPNVMMSPTAFLQKPFRWLSAISHFGGTTSGGPNFAYDLCVRRVTAEQRERLDLSAWKVAFNGAEPVRAETLERFIEAFEPCGFRPEAFYPCYGLAEATLIVSGGYVRRRPTLRLFDRSAMAEDCVVEIQADGPEVRKLVGCGGTMPDQEIAIVDPQTKTRCPEGRVAEIWVRGPSVAQGYWNEAEATRETFQAYVRDTGEGPFLRTGDLGFLRDGELFVTGRIKDMIIVHGVNHYPHDIEATVQESHPSLRPGCTAAFSLEREGGEEVVVVQEVERGRRTDPEPVFAAIRRAVQSEHDVVLDTIVLIRANSIPKTSSGKIQRHACRDAYSDGSLKLIAQWRGDTAESPATQPSGNGRMAGHAAAPVERASSPVVRSAPARAPAIPTSQGPLDLETIARQVRQEVAKVAKDRAANLSLDSSLLEIGLDSLERMEIVASVEDRFGGRLPEEILLDLITCRDVARAVHEYMLGGDEPTSTVALGSASDNGEIPVEHYQVSQFPECVGLRQRLELFDKMGLENPFFHVHQSAMGARTVIDGREVINFGGFNYVGLSGHPDVARAAKAAVDRYGTSVSASRLVSGEKDLHLELESEIAGLYGTDDAIVLSSGHGTNESVIGHMFGPGDLILHDALAHNSIVQGAKLSGARKRPFAHNDWRAADELLRQLRSRYRRVLIAIEGVYSMDGDIPNLPEFVKVKNRHKALLMIDEAHSLGTLGKGGRGIAEHFGIDTGEVEIWMGTLSKSLGSCGGYITGSKDLIRYLKYTAPGFVFATGVSPANTAAALAAIRVLRDDPGRVERLRRRSRLFLDSAKRCGMNTGTSKDTPVVPIILGNSIHCLQVAAALLERGINARPILHPAVEESASRLRFFINSEHTEEDIRFTIEVLAEELARLDQAYVQPEVHAGFSAKAG